MKRFLRGALCVLLCCAALFCTVQSVALASDAVSPSELESDEERERPDLEDMRVYVGGLLSGRAFKNGDDVYKSAGHCEAHSRHGCRRGYRAA